MKKLLNLTLSLIITTSIVLSMTVITASCEENDENGNKESGQIVKLVSNLQNETPLAIPAQKVQLAWIARGAGNSDENFAANGETSANFTNASNTGKFSYEFTCADEILKGRVQGDEGEVRIFALRNDINTARNNLANNTYAEIMLRDGDSGEALYRGATGNTLASEYEKEVYDFAMKFVEHFDSITEYRHSHYNPTSYKPLTIRESAETFPISREYIAPNGSANPPVEGDPEKCITFVYSRDDLGGMMSAMIDGDGTVKHITNLENMLYTAIPAQKVQLAWIARGAGNTDENFAANGETSANFTNASNTGKFSYEFTCADEILKGRVQGDEGEVRIFALRNDINTARNNLANNTYAEIMLRDGTAGKTLYRGPTSGAGVDTLASEYETEVYDFAMKYVEHFDSITERGHDHVNHTIYKPDTIRESAERFPHELLHPTEFGVGQAGHVATGDNSKKSIVFVYSRDDLGGMMSAMIDGSDGTVKHITNLENKLYTAIPAQKVQLAWIARGAGNTDENFAANGETSANFTNASNTGEFSYEFTCADEILKGRVQGDEGTVRIFALRNDINTARNNLANNTYAEIILRDGDSGKALYRGATGNTLASEYETEVYDFAMKYVEHFDSITEFQHDHVNHTTYKPDTIRESAERFPIERGIFAVENPEQCIVFTYSRDDLGGMMSAMIIADAPPEPPDEPDNSIEITDVTGNVTGATAKITDGAIITIKGFGDVTITEENVDNLKVVVNKKAEIDKDDIKAFFDALIEYLKKGA